MDFPVQPNLSGQISMEVSMEVREDYQLIETTGHFLEDRSLDITSKNLGSGFTLFCFNLEPDERCSGNGSLIKTSNVTLEVNLKKKKCHTL